MMGDRASSAEGKGKEKANDQATRSRDRDQDHDHDHEAVRGRNSAGQGSGPIISRIANSAAALSSALLSGAPDSAGLSRLANGEKGEASGSQAQASLSRISDSSTEFRRSVLPSNSGPQSSAQARHYVATEEAAFAEFLDSTSVFVPTAPGLGDLDTSSWQPNNDSSSHSLSHAPITEPWVQGTSRVEVEAGGASSSVAQQELNDGGEVVMLLLENTESLPDEFGDETYSSYTSADLPGLREALFDEGSGGGTSEAEWNNVLNFIPELLCPGDSSGEHGADDAASNHVRAQEMLMQLGTADPDEAWHIWIDQWSGVLTRYQDEVWGDLGSLVREARAEVGKLEQANSAEPPPGMKALLRLRSILGHLRGS